MMTGVWEAKQNKASAKAELTADGKLTVGTATNDIGTGTYTALSQIAADYMGVSIENVTCNLGDSSSAAVARRRRFVDNFFKRFGD